MIFPKVKLSELKADRMAKQEQFDASIHVFKSNITDTIQDNARPLKLLKSNPKFVIGALVSAFAGFKVLAKINSKTGLFKKVATFGGAMLANRFLPHVSTLLIAGLEKALKKRR